MVSFILLWLCPHPIGVFSDYEMVDGGRMQFEREREVISFSDERYLSRVGYGTLPISDALMEYLKHGNGF